MSKPGASLTRGDAVLTLTLDRADKLNAINNDIEEALREAIATFGADPGLRVLLIAARGDYFSAGFDVEHRVDDDHDPSGILLRRRYRELHDLFDLFEQVEKPVVVAAHGPCLGGALEFALSCDFRLAATPARFGLPEIKLGVLPGSGGTSRLTRTVGPAWARWLVMAGQQVTAEEALRMGLVHAVYPAESFADDVAVFIDRMAALPGEAVGLAKIAIDLADRLDRGSGRDLERVANTVLMTSQDHRDRVNALKKRLAQER
ncbi:enoyl-CoA hydratase/isomerase family protein [Mycolicibacterium moriokaense]|uniref:Enoyl-CoA hydratase/carnithine racemase n=1 Tax=Mycolicibacterium moriokaense TaxID=39691 RepID=A0A318H8I8_9MYCO|nr:enoyl-CoA hydratase/isomerase family protein [Mycolicibacterium moriokaense]PXX01639.1 enoyl-CoA hydratase/carnithine racemase [Mycolicibacterium moriokaense]